MLAAAGTLALSSSAMTAPKAVLISGCCLQLCCVGQMGRGIGHFMGNNIVLDVFRSEICEVEHGLLDDLLCFYPGGEQMGSCKTICLGWL
ncbi:metalloprotease TIKI1 isoform X2 [Castor canadensis]|uniref:Metalloprotease TIKI1 isoform X2 n=1 Tax=Castor canadensis TaxID=51338 RepID=A0AC58KMS6_CASCN